MLKIYAMSYGHKYWNDTIDFAEKCSWKAGPFLADMMKKNEFRDWERVFAALENEKIAGYCTFCEKDKLSVRYDFSPFIGFMFVGEKHRGKRISETLINTIATYAKEVGYDKIYVMSGEIGLYEKYGFVNVGKYETIYNSVDQLFVKNID